MSHHAVHFCSPKIDSLTLFQSRACPYGKAHYRSEKVEAYESCHIVISVTFFCEREIDILSMRRELDGET